MASTKVTDSCKEKMFKIAVCNSYLNITKELMEHKIRRSLMETALKKAIEHKDSKMTTLLENKLRVSTDEPSSRITKRPRLI